MKFKEKSGFAMLFCMIYTAITASMLVMTLQSSTLQSKIVNLSIKNFNFKDDLNGLFLKSKQYLNTFTECKQLNQVHQHERFFQIEPLYFYNKEELLIRVTIKSNHSGKLGVKQVYWLFICDEKSDLIIKKKIHHMKQYIY